MEIFSAVKMQNNVSFCVDFDVVKTLCEGNIEKKRVRKKIGAISNHVGLYNSENFKIGNRTIWIQTD